MKRIEIRTKLIKLFTKYTKQNAKNFLSLANDYLEQYPEDILIRDMRAKIHIINENYKSAIEDLNYNLLIDINIDSVCALFYIYYNLYMYEDALKLLPTMYKLSSEDTYSLKIMEYIMKKDLNIKFKDTDIISNYVKTQLQNYDMSLAINYIKSVNESSDVTSFNENINVDYLVEILSQNIHLSKKANKQGAYDYYYFSIFNVGIKYNDVCNYIKVFVIPKTNNIISMFPVSNIGTHIYNNIEYDYEKLFNLNKQQKTKQLSRIDKFNKKYGANIK